MGARVAIFDMDHTLIGVDSDLTWKIFAVEHGLASPSALAEAEKFMADYDTGKLDVAEFLRFQWREFAGRTVEEVQTLCRKHFTEKVLPFCRSAAKAEVDVCKKQGMDVWILTSTCRFLARPVADHFGIDRLFGSEIEIEDGKVTDRMRGFFPCGEGKVAAAKEIAASCNASLGDCRAYGDSINDLPLLLATGERFAVNPSPALRREAEKRNWTVLDWERTSIR